MLLGVDAKVDAHKVEVDQAGDEGVVLSVRLCGNPVVDTRAAHHAARANRTLEKFQSHSYTDSSVAVWAGTEKSDLYAISATPTKVYATATVIFATRFDIHSR